MKHLFLLSFSLLTVVLLSAQQMSPAQLLEKSITYHDPAGQWGTAKLLLPLTETRPGGTDRNTMISWQPKSEKFVIDRTVDGVQTQQVLQNGECSYELNGKSDLTTEELEQHRLNCERTQTMRNYYTYLWGLPMKLKDPGTQLEEVQETDFQGKDVYALKVTYAPEVGADTWYFYFDKSTYALVGYRFYHDESKNDGEYITFEGETTIKKMRLPQTRKWYVNADNKFLGSDTLREK